MSLSLEKTTAWTVWIDSRSCRKQSILPCLREVAMRPRTHTFCPASVAVRSPMLVQVRAAAGQSD